ncbi:MAG: transcription antitermination factor NusB [Planctomycetota bacterium]
MAKPSDIRRLALVALFQLDASKGVEPESVRTALDDAEAMDEDFQIVVEDDRPLSEAQLDKAFGLALKAWEAREPADNEMTELAPDWPTKRQPAIDRAILRLAHFEMTSGRTPPKVAVNEAVELAKAFSTEKSPAFINGLLGKVLKRVLAAESSAKSDSAKSVAAESDSGETDPAETAPVADG